VVPAPTNFADGWCIYHGCQILNVVYKHLVEQRRILSLQLTQYVVLVQRTQVWGGELFEDPARIGVDGGYASGMWVCQSSITRIQTVNWILYVAYSSADSIIVKKRCKFDNARPGTRSWCHCQPSVVVWWVDDVRFGFATFRRQSQSPQLFRYIVPLNLNIEAFYDGGHQPFDAKLSALVQRESSA
jgi:hypothetical protein